MDFSALNRVDEYGNKMSLRPDGVIALYLAKENRTRLIGSVGETSQGRPFYDKVVKEENRFRKTDAWGLNWDVLELLPLEAVIRLRSEIATYMIMAREAKSAGDFLFFKTQGFERQFFIPVSAFSVQPLVKS